MTTLVGERSVDSERATAKKIVTGDDYIESLRGRGLKIHLFGELVDEPVDHPIIRPSINAVVETYDLAVSGPAHRAGSLQGVSTPSQVAKASVSSTGWKARPMGLE